MKKLIVFFCLCLLVFTNSSLAKENPKIYLENIAKYDNSENVTINIYMENVNSDIAVLGLDLKYDTSKLEYVSSKAGKDLKATVKLDENIPEESRVSIAIMSLNGLRNDGLYYQITFKGKDNNGTTPLDISVREATDSDGNEINIETLGTEVSLEKQEYSNNTKNQKNKIIFCLIVITIILMILIKKLKIVKNVK